MDVVEDHRILKFTNDAKLPSIKQLKLDKLSEEIDLNLEKFLRYSIPQSLQSFCLNWSYKCRLNIKNYTDLLIPIIQRTTKEVYIYYSIMDYDQFSKIVQASKTCERLIFRYVKLIKTGKIDFGKSLDYKISYLGLSYAGHENYCDWRTDKTEYQAILKEIKESNMEKQLQTIDIHQCNLTVPEVTLTGIDVVFQDLNPLET